MIFHRSLHIADTSTYYAENTDVWVLGTTQDYESFVAHLERHVAGTSSHTHLPAREDRGGMDVLLMPTASKAVKPFLLLHERIVYQRGRFNMELLIGGSGEGFDFVRNAFEMMLRKGIGDVSDHVHVGEFDCPILFLPAISLNVRGPAREWSAKAFSHYWEGLIVPGATPELPEHHRSPERETYEMPGYSDLHGRLREFVPASFRRRRRPKNE